jgi:fido (protein-threonine AMPylation protein)
MPHRAGYFVLAYHWDHHCHDLMQSLKQRMRSAEERITELERSSPIAGQEACGFSARWSACRADFQAILQETEHRRAVIDELGYRGYGVNRDLHGALEAFANEHRDRLGARLELLRSKIEPGTVLAPPVEADPRAKQRERYFQVMSQETPWAVNTAIFQKLFLEMGTSSTTIMRGTTGLHDTRPPQELKKKGNHNFMDMYREAFSTLHAFTDVGFDLLKRIHWLISKGLDDRAGSFRTIDFPDRNGVTFEFGNFDRELGDLGIVLREAGQSFHQTKPFVHNLARSYYMLIAIHPFWDSNGRVGRAFVNHMFLKKGLPPATFRDDEEIFALPRYGGSMEDMDAYFQRLIDSAIESYFHERKKLQELGFFNRPIFNVSFDSGFHFRQVDSGNGDKLEVRFRAYLAPDGSTVAKQLLDSCRVVVPDEKLLRNLAVHCGFSEAEHGELKQVLDLQKPSFVEEIPSDVPQARVFDVGLVLTLEAALRSLRYFSCLVVSPEDQRVFSNKGLRYSCSMERRAAPGKVRFDSAEALATPSYKWIGERRSIESLRKRTVTQFPGGIGFSLQDFEGTQALKVLFKVYQADGACERYLTDAYPCSQWGESWQRWQTHRLPLFPFDGRHGHLTFATFSYLVHKNGKVLGSQHSYKFAALEDFFRGSIDGQDFYETGTEGEPAAGEVSAKALRTAYKRLNRAASPAPVTPLFTRGSPGSPDHPSRHIHRDIDWVIERQRADPKGRHTIRLAIYDFDNPDVANHLIYAKENGVEVDCVGDWGAVSALDGSENVARMRRAGIPILGLVRNTPGSPQEGIASMHTKIILLDEEIVHCSSYNLQFHLWPGNWEDGLVVQSKAAALVFANVFNAIKGGVIREVEVDPKARCNFYYSFGGSIVPGFGTYRPQDAIISEIANARESIELCMFDIGFLAGRSLADGRETDVVSALIEARDRGVRVRIALNGLIAHTGPEPEPWDKDFPRPLKEAVRRLVDAWMEVNLVHYWDNIRSPVHHKFAVIDRETVLTGSCNWYEASAVSDEVLAVIRDRGLAEAYSGMFAEVLRTFRISKQ